MQYKTSEVRQIGKNLLSKCSFSGTGRMLVEMVDCAEGKGSTVVNTDNKCVMSVMRTARESMTACVGMYAN
jgi:hypothetical protein